MLSIPFDNTKPAFQQQIVIDGDTFVFSFVWSLRESAWFLSVLGLDLTPFVSGIKLVLGVELLQVTRRPGIPPGELWAVSSDPKLLRLAQNSIPDTVELVYIPVAA